MSRTQKVTEIKQFVKKSRVKKTGNNPPWCLTGGSKKFATKKKKKHEHRCQLGEYSSKIRQRQVEILPPLSFRVFSFTFIHGDVIFYIHYPLIKSLAPLNGSQPTELTPTK